MPNWCDNTLTITARKEVIDGIVAELEKEQPELLEYMVPLGEWDYSKSVENWGTKWDVGEIQWDRSHECTIDLSFQSAWSPPLKAYETWLDKQDDPNVSLSAYYWEPGMGFAGFYENGIDEYYEWTTKAELLAEVPEYIRDHFGLDEWYDDEEENEDDA